jgi:predicted nucleotidyltransferase
MKINGQIEVPDEAVEQFCRKWKITQIEAFGSVLRDDFRPDSDIDLLVTFEPDSGTSLFDIVEMQDELTSLAGRKVDLHERAGVERSRNPFRKRSILSTAQVIYRVA